MVDNRKAIINKWLFDDENKDFRNTLFLFQDWDNEEELEEIGLLIDELQTIREQGRCNMMVWSCVYYAALGNDAKSVLWNMFSQAQKGRQVAWYVSLLTVLFPLLYP